MDENYTSLSLKAKKSWIITRLIILLSLITTAIIFIIIFDFNKWVIGISGFIIMLQVLNTIIYPQIEYRQWGYIINDQMIEFKKGIYFIGTTIIPIVRIQNIKINQGPINRVLHLADIQIFTAGGNYKIPNLDIDIANSIAHSLRDKVNREVSDNDRG